MKDVRPCHFGVYFVKRNPVFDVLLFVFRKLKFQRISFTMQATKSPEKLMGGWTQCGQTDFPFDYSGQETDRQKAYICIENSNSMGEGNCLGKKKVFQMRKIHTHIP